VTVALSLTLSDAEYLEGLLRNRLMLLRPPSGYDWPHGDKAEHDRARALANAIFAATNAARRPQT
jgi:hypothetical protein